MTQNRAPTRARRRRCRSSTGLACLVEGAAVTRGVELDVAAQIEAVGDVVEVAQDLRLGGDTLGPVPFLLQLRSRTSSNIACSRRRSARRDSGSSTRCRRPRCPARARERTGPSGAAGAACTAREAGADDDDVEAVRFCAAVIAHLIRSARHRTSDDRGVQLRALSGRYQRRSTHSPAVRRLRPSLVGSPNAVCARLLPA